MRKHVLWAVIVVTAALIQTTWLHKISVHGALPDLTLLLVVYFAITEGEERAMFTGVLGGLFQDVTSRTALGHHILCNVVIGYAVGRLTARLVTDHPAVKAGLVFCAAVVNGLLYTAILYVQQPDVRALRIIGAIAIPGSFYTALVTPVVFLLLDRSFGRRTAAGGETV